jgi:hypothetical protein
MHLDYILSLHVFTVMCMSAWFVAGQLAKMYVALAE